MYQICLTSMAQVDLCRSDFFQKRSRVGSRCAYADDHDILAGILRWILKLSGMDKVARKLLNPGNNNHFPCLEDTIRNN